MKNEEEQEESLNGLEIGTAITSYDDEGNVTHAQFRPKMILNYTEQLESQMRGIKGVEDSEVIRENSNAVFANWFNSLTVIELADREKYKVESEVVHCEKHPNGRVMDCYIKYVFKKL